MTPESDCGFSALPIASLSASMELEIFMGSLRSTFRDRARLGFLLASMGVVCAVAVLPAAFLVPVYHGESASGGGVVTTLPSKTLVAMNGLWVVGLLSVPLFLALVAWVGLRLRCSHGGAFASGVRWTAVGLLWEFVLIGSTSIGVFVLPVALLLVVAAKLTPIGRPRSASCRS